MSHLDQGVADYNLWIEYGASGHFLFGILKTNTKSYMDNGLQVLMAQPRLLTTFSNGDHVWCLKEHTVPAVISTFFMIRAWRLLQA